jgi:hypothetical protein
MAAQKFDVGQTVRIVPSPYIQNAKGKFNILSVLPDEHGMHQYQIKSTADERVHIVMEIEIVLSRSRAQMHRGEACSKNVCSKRYRLRALVTTGLDRARGLAQ